MIVKINGKRVETEVNQLVLVDTGKEIETKVNNIFKKHLMPASVATGIISVGTRVLAATGGTAGLADKLMPLVHMIQDFALPVGIIVATWGLIEIMIGNPGGKQKIKFAVLGYCGIFIVPEVFYAIRGAFRA